MMYMRPNLNIPANNDIINILNEENNYLQRLKEKEKQNREYISLYINYVNYILNVRKQIWKLPPNMSSEYKFAYGAVPKYNVHINNDVKVFYCKYCADGICTKVPYQYTFRTNKMHMQDKLIILYHFLREDKYALIRQDENVDNRKICGICRRGWCISINNITFILRCKYRNTPNISVFHLPTHMRRGIPFTKLFEQIININTIGFE